MMLNVATDRVQNELGWHSAELRRPIADRDVTHRRPVGAPPQVHLLADVNALAHAVQ